MIGAGVGDIFWIIMLNCSERIPGLYFWVLLLVVRKYQGSSTLQTVGHPVAPSMSGSSNSFSAFLGSSSLVKSDSNLWKHLSVRYERWSMVCHQVSRGVPEVLGDPQHLVHSWRLVALSSYSGSASLVSSDFFFSFFVSFLFFLVWSIFFFPFFFLSLVWPVRWEGNEGPWLPLFCPNPKCKDFLFIPIYISLLTSGDLDVVQDCHLFCDSQLNHYNDLGLPCA